MTCISGRLSKSASSLETGKAVTVGWLVGVGHLAVLLGWFQHRVASFEDCWIAAHREGTVILPYDIVGRRIASQIVRGIFEQKCRIE